MSGNYLYMEFSSEYNMSVKHDVRDALKDGIPFVAIMGFWIVITALIYGGFVVTWPDIPEAEPWIFLGIYILPIIGYLGHTAQQARKHSRKSR